ncbi:MAG: hypothetical protein HZB56_17705, partial [Deltaproteobacteria bacterium]|nr:hypothetical protein [Deltaproteobacteria bacterium]
MRGRILTAFGAVLFLVAVLAAVSWRNAGQLGAIVDNFSQRKLPSTEALQTLRQSETAVRANGAVMSSPVLAAELRDDARKRFAAAVERVEASARSYGALPHGARTAELWKAYGPAAERWKRDVGAFQEAVQERERAGAQAARAEALDRRIAETYSAMYRSSAPVVDTVKKLLEQTAADARALDEEAGQVEKAVGVSLAVALVAIAATLMAMGFFLARSIDGAIRGLVSEAEKLTRAVEAGELRTRGDLAAVNAEFQPVVAGVNRTMDAFQKPIQVTQDYVTRISRGDIPPRITDSYAGDFNQIIEALNRCIDAVNLLVQDAHALSKAAVEGKLSTRADAGKHQGDFQKVVAGVNATLDAVLAPIDEARKTLERLA